MSETTQLKTTQPKKWKNGKVFNTFLEADEVRKSLLSEDSLKTLLVKVRRCGDEGSRFRIKTWAPIALKKKSEDKKSGKKNNKPTGKKKNSR